jgi:hypothetical protein
MARFEALGMGFVTPHQTHQGTPPLRRYGGPKNSLTPPLFPGPFQFWARSPGKRRGPEPFDTAIQSLCQGLWIAASNAFGNPPVAEQWRSTFWAEGPTVINCHKSRAV